MFLQERELQKVMLKLFGLLGLLFFYFCSATISTNNGDSDFFHIRLKRQYQPGGVALDGAAPDGGFMLIRRPITELPEKLRHLFPGADKVKAKNSPPRARIPVNHRPRKPQHRLAVLNPSTREPVSFHEIAVTLPHCKLLQFRKKNEYKILRVYKPLNFC